MPEDCNDPVKNMALWSMEMTVALTRRWGVRVMGTHDRRSADRPLKIERTFTKIGAEARVAHLMHRLNPTGGPLRFTAVVVEPKDCPPLA